MNKSHLSKPNQPGPVVGPHDIGNVVNVQSVGRGILRYFGPIEGKEGLFCGIELRTPIGKHNGSYQGVAYFNCQPMHGIFAPPYKVQLEEPDDVPMLTESMIAARPPERLSRSALASLPLRSVLTQHEPRDRTLSRERLAHLQRNPPPQANQTDPVRIPTNMEFSMMSDLSQMDGSTFSTGSWGGIEMDASHRTYIVPHQQSYLLDEDSDLMAVAAPKSTFKVDREELNRHKIMTQSTYGQLGDSFVIERSSVGVHNLPIVEDEEEPTPLVERRDLPSSSTRTFNMNEDDMQHATASTSEAGSEGLLSRVASHDTGLHSENGFASRDLSQENLNETYSVNRTFTARPASATRTPATSSKPSVMTRNPSPTQDAAARPARARTSLAPVAAPAPKFPVKPKAPSKSQLMMEQIKASIEAEKNKPKRETKARVSLLPPPPKVPTPTQENMPEGKSEETPASSRKSSVMKKQPLKAVNPPAPAVERPKKERKPLYVPPPPKERPPKEVKENVATPSAASAKTVTKTSAGVAETNGAAAPPPESSVNGTAVTIRPKAGSSSTASAAFPTSSFAPGSRSSIGPARTARTAAAASSSTRSASSASGTIPAAKSAKAASVCDESKKLQRLKDASTAATALAIVVHSSADRQTRLEQRVAELSEQIERQRVSSDDLLRQLAEEQRRHQEDVERSRARVDELTRSHAEVLERLNERHEQQLSDKTRESERALEDEKARQQCELEAVNRRHQTILQSVEEKLTEAEKQVAQLTADKKSLQDALANDADQRNQTLSKEIASLQTALEFRSNENKEIRLKNQELSLKIEEIPMKDLEITKLKHKITELKSTIDSKLINEKQLLHTVEEHRRAQRLADERFENLQRTIDIMQFSQESDELLNGSEIEDVTQLSTPGRNFTTPNSRVKMRSASNTLERNHHGSSARHSQLSDMDKSMDSLSRSTASMYRSVQMRENPSSDDDVIYAPDEIITGRSCRRLSFGEGEVTLAASEANGNAAVVDTF